MLKRQNHYDSNGGSRMKRKRTKVDFTITKNWPSGLAESTIVPILTTQRQHFRLEAEHIMLER